VRKQAHSQMQNKRQAFGCGIHGKIYVFSWVLSSKDKALSSYFIQYMHIQKKGAGGKKLSGKKWPNVFDFTIKL